MPLFTLLVQPWHPPQPSCLPLPVLPSHRQPQNFPRTTTHSKPPGPQWPPAAPGRLPAAPHGHTTSGTSPLQDTTSHRHHLVRRGTPGSPPTSCPLAAECQHGGTGDMVWALPLQGWEWEHPKTPLSTCTRTSPAPLGSSWSLTWAGLGPTPILPHWHRLHILVGALRVIHAKGCWRKAGENS